MTTFLSLSLTWPASQFGLCAYPAWLPIPFLAGDTFTQNNRNIQMVKVGINYLFNWSRY